MKPKLIATSNDGLFNIYATFENPVGDAVAYWGYIERDGKRTKPFNISRFLLENDGWSMKDDNKKQGTTLPTS